MLLTQLCCTWAGAQTTAKAICGWGEDFRLGRWTPVFVTVADHDSRNVILRVTGTYGVGSSLEIHQQLAATPQPMTFALLVPVNADLSHCSVIVSDATTGKTLATQLLERPAEFTAAGKVPQQILAADEPLVGLSGDIPAALQLRDQLSRVNVPAGLMNADHLPANGIGYEGISVLVLVSADLHELGLDQQRAMVEWIRRGGNLVIIPSLQPLQEAAFLADFLPCNLGPDERLTGGGAASQSAVNGRRLLPREGAQAVDFMIMGASAPQWLGYSRRIGMGRITVLPGDISSLQISDETNLRKMWASIFSDMFTLPKAKILTARTVTEEQEADVPAGARLIDSIGRGTRETFGIRHMLDALDASSARLAGTPAWMIWMLLGVCVLLGPVDSIVLMRLGQHPRHWMTLLGWLGVLAMGVILIAKSVGQGEVTISTFRLIDQADDAAIAATDIIAIESSNSRRLPLKMDAAEFWEPANQSAEKFGPDRFIDFRLHQDRQGTRPDEIRLSAGQPQSFHGESTVAGAPLVGGQLRISRDASGKATISGRLINLSKSAMSDIHIGTAAGNCRIEGTIAPGASIEIKPVLLASGAIALAGLPADVSEVTPQRSDRIETLLKGGDLACVYCQMPDAPGIAVTDGVDAAVHFQVVRAVIGLAK